jgi:hypothetical protein
MADRENEWGCTVTADDRESWEAYLDDFERFVWPIFKQRGYARDNALALWLGNQQTQILRGQRDLLQQLVELLLEGGEEENF